MVGNHARMSSDPSHQWVDQRHPITLPLVHLAAVLAPGKLSRCHILWAEGYGDAKFARIDAFNFLGCDQPNDTSGRTFPSSVMEVGHAHLGYAKDSSSSPCCTKGIWLPGGGFQVL
jgi:hypothetical protein